jgi:diguanylate cyclase (GGDEF)-like protein/PAS domain S-box-containing protein
MRPPLLIAIVLLLLVEACSVAEDPESRLAEAGQLDLSGWDFASQGTVALDGEWEFYWSQLLTPEEIASQSASPRYQSVPALWTSYSDDMPVKGYATYRLQVSLPDDEQVLALLLIGQGSSSRLWVDGELVASDGDVGTEKGETVRSGRPQIVYLAPQDRSMELVFQVSNFSHRSPGFRASLLLGDPDELTASLHNNSIFESVYMSLLLGMALYHFFLYTQRRSQIFSLWFACLCLLAGIRLGVTGNDMLASLLPFLGWEITFRLEYLTFFLSTPSLAVLMRSIYPEDFDRWFLRLTVSVALAYSLFVLLSSTLVASYTVPSYQVVLMLEVIYFLYFLLRIFWLKRQGRYFVGAATLVGLLGLVSEILSFNGLLPFVASAPVGMVGFVFVQAAYLAAYYSASFRQVEELSGKLEQNLRELEESEAKYRGIFEESNDVIFVADKSGRIVDISPSCEDLLGLTPEEVKGNETNVYASASKEDRSRFARRMGRDEMVREFEVGLTHRDGRKIRVLLNASTRLDKQGRVIGIQGTVRDISDRIQAQQQRERADELELIASTDPLTGAHTRRYFDDVAAREMARSARNNSPLALVILDIDHFKATNDNHGHLAGDKVLVALAELCNRHIRSTDIFCRFGGEEFILLMPETSLEDAIRKTESLRRLVAAKPLVEFNGVEIAATFSAGVAVWNGEEDIEELIARADQGLYRAKEGGRNCCMSGEAQAA